MNVAKYSLPIVILHVTKKELLYGQANIRVQGEESVPSQVMNCATTPGLPYVHVQNSKHLKKDGNQELRVYVPQKHVCTNSVPLTQ